MTLLCVTYLWAYSFPGVAAIAFIFVVPLLTLSSVVWLGWLAVRWRPWRRGCRQRWSWAFVVVPLLGALTLGLVSTNVPFTLRWSLARGDFDTVASRLPDPTRGSQPSGETENPVQCGSSLNTPTSIGGYSIINTCRIPFGYTFEESHGALFASAGFAYLPKGSPPDYVDGSFGPPQWHHLDGPWYSWIASD